MRKPKVLFISHDATRTGAPIIFLNLLQWLAKHADIDGAVLLRNGGEMQTEFSKLYPTYQIDAGQSTRYRLLKIFKASDSENILARKVPIEDLTKVVERELRPDVVYSNTITNGELLQKIRPLGIPVITHVHELDFWIRNRVGAEQFAITDRNTDIYVTVSKAVSQNLIDRWQVSPSRIRMVYGFVPTSLAVDRPSQRELTRRELGIPDGAFVVGGCGTLDWRKAPEHIVQLTLYLNQGSDRPVHAVWVGGNASKLRRAELQHDISLAGLAGKVHFIGSKASPLEYFSAFDVFAMVSREDPFPLVNLETASLGIPIVCFSGAGGSSEFVADQCGIEVPYLDVQGMATQILALMRDPDRLHVLGENARERVKKEHSLPTQAAKIAEVISELLPSQCKIVRDIPPRTVADR